MTANQIDQWFQNLVVIQSDKKTVSLSDLAKSFNDYFQDSVLLNNVDFLKILRDYLQKRSVPIDCRKVKFRGKKCTLITGIGLKPAQLSNKVSVITFCEGHNEDYIVENTNDSNQERMVINQDVQVSSFSANDIELEARCSISTDEHKVSPTSIPESSYKNDLFIIDDDGLESRSEHGSFEALNVYSPFHDNVLYSDDLTHKFNHSAYEIKDHTLTPERSHTDGNHSCSSLLVSDNGDRLCYAGQSSTNVNYVDNKTDDRVLSSDLSVPINSCNNAEFCSDIEANRNLDFPSSESLAVDGNSNISVTSPKHCDSPVVKKSDCELFEPECLNDFTDNHSKGNGPDKEMSDRNSLLNYFSKSQLREKPEEITYSEKTFSFRKESKESSHYDNLTFSRFYQNFKTITPSQLQCCHHDNFEDFLHSKFPLFMFKSDQLKSMILRARSASNGLEARMNAFLCGSFPPICTGNMASKALEHLEVSIWIPQFTAQSYSPNLVFKCEVCEIYRGYLKQNGKACSMGPGIFEGCKQLYDHSVTNHHKSSIDFLKRDSIVKKSKEGSGKKEHISSYFDVSCGKGKSVSCMFLWDPEIVNEFKLDQNIRRKSPKSLFIESKVWRKCLNELHHENCQDYNVWKAKHPRDFKAICEESKSNSSRSVFVPANDQKILVKGKTVVLVGGIKSLDPPCLGTALSAGPHPFTCENCHKQRKALKNLKSFREKKASLPKTESRLGKKGMRTDYASKHEKEQHYLETIEKNEALVKLNKAYKKQVMSKTNWEKMLLESCQKEEVRKLVLDLVLLIESKDNSLEIKKEIIKNLLGKLRSGINHKFEPIIKDVAAYYHNSLGPDKYSLLQNLFGLPGKTCAKQHGHQTKLQLGMNEEVFERGVALYDGYPVIDATDEARTLRMLSGVVGKEEKIEVIGQCWEPDIDDWEESRSFLEDIVGKQGFPDEFSALKNYADKTISKNQLAKSTGIHNLVSASGLKSKPLIYLVWPTPNSGYRSFHLLKIWDVVRSNCFLLPSGELRKEPINLVGHASDSAGFQLAAAVSLMTPQSQAFKVGVKYLTLDAGDSQFAAPYFGPLPSIAYLDYDHNLRLFLKCLKYETLDLDFFPCPTNSHMVSINHLRELKDILDGSGNSHLCSFSNNDLLFARFLDQNVDAALKVFTPKVAQLLQEHVPGSSATSLYIEGVVALFKPFLNPDCNPVSCQESLSVGITVFRIWKQILKKKGKRLSAVKNAAKDSSKRGRFLTYGCAKTSEILFAAGTCHMLAMFAHFKELGTAMLPLSNCGTKTTERIISEIQGKTNQMQSLDAQPTLSGIMQKISKVQTNHTAEDNILAAGGKKLSTTNRRRLSQKLKVAESCDYAYPETFAEFQQQQQGAFRSGVEKGIDLYRKYCPEGIEFLEKKGGLSFLQKFENNVPEKNKFDGCLDREYAVEKLNLKSAELLSKGAVEEENLITNYLNPEDKAIVSDTDEKFDDKKLISDEVLDDLESGDRDELEEGSEASEKRKWFLSRIVNGEIKDIHLAQALKIFIPREFVSRERSRRHIAARFLPDRGEVDEKHNVVAFRFVVSMVAKNIQVCKVAALNSNGKSVMSASNLDDKVTCLLIPLEKVPSENNLYILPKKIIISNWIKVSNVIGELKMSCNQNGQYSILEKSLSVLQAAEESQQLSEDLKYAQKLSNSLPPKGFYEVADISEKKLDPKTEECLYLVKFKGQECDPIWLTQSCFDRPINFSKRKGFDSSEKVFAAEDSFLKFALDGEVSSKKPKVSKKRLSSSPLPVPSVKKRKTSDKSRAKLKKFSFNKASSERKGENTSLIDVDCLLSDAEGDGTDEKIFEESIKKVADGRWINDIVIKKAVEMIQKQFPNIKGLQDPMKSKSKFAKLQPVPRNNDNISMQIHHDGLNHWVLSVCKGTELYIYDSLNIHNKPSQNLKEQLLLCYMNHLDEGKLKIQYKRVLKQAGTSDCGLFCIAYAVDIANGRFPETFCYSQELMRKHLLDCFEKAQLVPFPVGTCLVSEEEELDNSFVWEFPPLYISM